MTNTQPYDRAARRLADNAHGNTRSGDSPWDEGDDIQRATYADPKARHLNGDNDIVKAKRNLVDSKVDSEPFPGAADTDHKGDVKTKKP